MTSIYYDVMMMKLGLVGYRGMVGSVLLERMSQENDFDHFATTLFSTSQAGKPAPNLAQTSKTLADAYDLESLSAQDVILSCQGGSYTDRVHKELREFGWQGFWIDAASSLRMSDDAILALDPLNYDQIVEGIKSGKRDFIGSNCTVSTMMMGLAGLLQNDLIEWISSMTYQAASGAGAANVVELLQQMQQIGDYAATQPTASMIDYERSVSEFIRSDGVTVEHWPAPLAANILPWIDKKLENGQSREEWKAQVEANKILGRDDLVIDGTCVRVGALRCHSQGLTIKLKKHLPLDEISAVISGAHEWVEVIPNDPVQTYQKLTPAALSGSMNIRVGRLRYLNMGDTYLNAFVIGDQLLWGAAEPLRRVLRIIEENT